MRSQGFVSSVFRSLGLSLALALACASCKTASGGSSTSEKTSEATSKASSDEGPSSGIGADTKDSAAANVTPGAEKGKGGQFIYKIEEPTKKKSLAKYKPIFDDKRLPAIIGMLNRTIKTLPRDIPVVAGECGNANAFYMPSKHAVILCYELVEDFYTKYRKTEGATDESASVMTANGLAFTVLHELGHAVIGELKLGVTGGEEDAVDEFAAILLLDNKQPDMAVDGALAMLALDSKGKTPHSDEHSLGPQRFYNILCIVLGSDPKKHERLVDNPVPKQRAVRCPNEYKQKNRAWETLLKDHM